MQNSEFPSLCGIFFMTSVFSGNFVVLGFIRKVWRRSGVGEHSSALHAKLPFRKIENVHHSTSLMNATQTENVTQETTIWLPKTPNNGRLRNWGIFRLFHSLRQKNCLEFKAERDLSQTSCYDNRKWWNVHYGAWYTIEYISEAIYRRTDLLSDSPDSNTRVRRTATWKSLSKHRYTKSRSVFISRHPHRRCHSSARAALHLNCPDVTYNFFPVFGLY